MTLTAAKSGGWTSHQELTTVQLNHLNSSLPMALDKTIAGDTLDGYINVSSTGGFGCDGSVSLYDDSVMSSLTPLTIYGSLELQSGSLPTLLGAVTCSNFTTDEVKVASRSISRTISCIPWIQDFGIWTIEDGGILRSVTTSSYDRLYFEMDLPHGSTLTEISCTVIPKAGHADYPDPPKCFVQRVNMLTGEHLYLNAITDELAMYDLAAYEVAHTFSDPDLSIPIDRETYRYCLMFQSEGNASALDTFQVVGASATVTITAYEEFS